MSDPRPRPFTDDEFRAIYSRVPRLCVDIIVKINGGVVLMKRQEASWNGQWHIPGGTVFYQEPVTETLKRVAQEELHLEIQPGPLLGYLEYPSEVATRGFGWSVGLAFLCQANSEIDHVFWHQEQIQIFHQVPENTIEEQRALLEQVLATNS